MNYNIQQSAPFPEEVDGIIQAFCASAIALTITESLMIGVNRSGLPSEIRIFAVRYGELLFVPACVWVGWVARFSGPRRILIFAGSLATAYMMLCWTRGSWIWSGTFDQYMYPKTPWIMPAITGISFGCLLCIIPSNRVAKARSSPIFLCALSLSVVLSVVLPRYWPNDSEFAATRFVALGVLLLLMFLLWLFGREENEAWI